MTVFENKGSDQSLQDIENYKKRFTKEDGSIDMDALLKKSFHQEGHIGKLEDEGARFRDDLKARSTLEDLLAKIEKVQTPSSEGAQNQPNEPNTPPSNPIDLEKIVSAKLTDFEKKLAYQQNADYVKKELTKSWGEDYVSKLRAKAKELGESEEFLERLAAEKPRTFLQLVNPTTKVSNDYVPPNNEIRTAVGGNAPMSTYNDFEKVRKENPTLYWSPKVQNALYEAAKSAKARGEDFYKK